VLQQVWPESLHWEATGVPKVDLKFDDPEEGTNSPKKWEAHSSEGFLKVRWRQRKIDTSNHISYHELGEKFFSKGEKQKDD
jgi:hypothetical protein